MAILNQEQARTQISRLIENHRALENPELQSEANVRANFIDPLFAALNWPVHDTVYYNHEEYIRGAGFAEDRLVIRTDQLRSLMEL